MQWHHAFAVAAPKICMPGTLHLLILDVEVVIAAFRCVEWRTQVQTLTTNVTVNELLFEAGTKNKQK